MKTIFRTLELVCLGAALSACAASTPPPLAQESFAETAATVAPAPQSLTLDAAKKAILRSKSKLFKDAPSVRDAKIGPPFACLDGNGSCICIEANAKNSYGGYTGIQVVGVKFGANNEAEMIGEMAQKAIGGVCGAMTPFPELNGRQRG